MLEGLPNNAQTRHRGDATSLTDRAIRSQDREVQPRVVRAIAGRDEHSSDVLSREVKSRDRGRAMTGRVPHCGQHLTAEACVVDVPIDGIEEAVHPGSASATVLSRVATERRDRADDFLEPAQRRTPRACSPSRSRSRPRGHGSGVADQLQRVSRRAADMGHLIDGTGEPTVAASHQKLSIPR